MTADLPNQGDGDASDEAYVELYELLVTASSEQSARDLLAEEAVVEESPQDTDVDRCAMGEDCYYPEGPSAFTEKRHPPDRWNRSRDHFPILKMDGGTLEAGNVRLMHNHCNKVDYSNLALEAHSSLLETKMVSHWISAQLTLPWRRTCVSWPKTAADFPGAASAIDLPVARRTKRTTSFVGLASRRVRRRHS